MDYDTLMKYIYYFAIALLITDCKPKTSSDQDVALKIIQSNGSPLNKITQSSDHFKGMMRFVPHLGAAFQPLEYVAYPGKSLFNSNMGGLNFEHIFNGVSADEKISWFTPRKDVHTIKALTDSSVVVVHTSEESKWGVESYMYYTFSERSVDMEFKVKLHKDRYPSGYAGFMWASYMQGTLDRCIHFYGTENGSEDWVSFGVGTKDGFETGTVAAAGVDPLPYEDKSATLNIIENRTKKFIHPFYYGLMDGDGNRETVSDTVAYVMMFEQSETMRFAMWNFEKDEAGNPDPTKPAWDWQYVINKPELNRWYTYKARMTYMPFVNREAILQYYLTWKAQK